MLEEATLDYQDTSKYATNAFLLGFIAFARQIGCLSSLSLVEVAMQEVIHSVSEKIETLLLSYTIACRCSNDINTPLGPDKLVAQSLGIDHFGDGWAFSRLYQRIDPLAVEDLYGVRQMLYSGQGLARHLTGLILADPDSTGLIVKGHQFELADKGYFAKHPGEIGCQLNIACASNAGKEVLAHILDPGHVNPGARFWDLLYQVGEALGFPDERLRADRLYGVGAYLTQLIDLQVGFLIKGRDSRSARRWVEELGSTIQWVQVDPTCWVANIGRRTIPNCPYPVRTILIRTLDQKSQTYDYSYLVTSLPPSECSEVDLFHFYNLRVTLEKLIERCKNVWHISHMPTHNFWGLLFYFELRFLAYNLVLCYQHYVPDQDERRQAIKVFELVTTVAPICIVAAHKPQTGLVLFLANAPQLIQSLLTLTQTWLQSLAQIDLVLLGKFCRLQFDRSHLIDDVCHATPRPDCWLLCASCKT